MNPARVLVVDDNLINLDLALFVLDSGGFIVDAAKSAAEAKERVPRFQPDLILMDVQMPGMDGLELCRQLKSQASTRHIVIVAFTAYAMKGDAEKMRAAGFDGYLPKPIEVATFCESVRVYLG